MAQLEYNATLIQRIELNDELIIMKVRPDEPLFDFVPGQYTTLGLKYGEPRVPAGEKELSEHDPEEVERRAYSIASSPLDRDWLEFYINLVPEGPLTPRLFHLRRGDRLYAGSKATGRFTLEGVPEDQHVVMISTGTGVAPFISMLRTELARPDCQRQMTIVHGARYSWDLGYRDELTTLARHCPGVRYLPSITRTHVDRDWRGATGRLQQLFADGAIEEFIGEPVTSDRFHVYVCGHPGLVEDIKSMLTERGFTLARGRTPGNIHVEEYW